MTNVGPFVIIFLPHRFASHLASTSPLFFDNGGCFVDIWAYSRTFPCHLKTLLAWFPFNLGNPGNGQAALQEPVIKTKTGLISQGVTKKPGEFSNWYISRIS